MLQFFQKKDLMVRILMGVVMGFIGLSMLTYLIPGRLASSDPRTPEIATVAGEEITRADIQRQLARITSRGAIPRYLESLYAKQVTEQLIFERLLEVEARRLGIRVSEEEQAERIKRMLPSAFAGDAFVGRERYEAEVQQRFAMAVSEFEELVRKLLLEEKFRRLILGGVTASDAELHAEFRKRNEKVKLDTVVIKPSDLASSIAVPEADIAQSYEKNKSRYQEPERRIARYALLDKTVVKQRVSVPETDLRAYYTAHEDSYRVQNRARVSHILFKTVGKTEAEIEEIRRKAEGVLQKARHGGKFDELARKNSEDSSKDAGGDLGWIVQGQTVAEFERAAFNQPIGAISDLVKTQYGFHIIRVAERESARTKSFEEVRGEISNQLTAERVTRTTDELSEQLAAGVRKSSRRPIEEIAKEFSLTVVEGPPVARGEPLADLGSSTALADALFRLRPGEISAPVRLDRGVVVLTVKEIRPPHPSGLAEVRDRILADLRNERAVGVAKARAEEFARRAQSAEGFDRAAKAMSLTIGNPPLVNRTGSVGEAGSARDFAAAFDVPVGRVSGPQLVNGKWVIYRVAKREEVKPEDFSKQRADLEREVMRKKADTLYDAFRSALRERMIRDGVLRVNEANLRQLTQPT